MADKIGDDAQPGADRVDSGNDCHGQQRRGAGFHGVRIGGANAGGARRVVVARDADVVDADPLVVAGGVGRDDSNLHQWLVRGVVRQLHGHRRHERREAGAGRRIGDESGGQVRVVAGRADAVLERDGLNGVVGGAVDVANVVRDRDVR